jgi:hypothetical protein
MRYLLAFALFATAAHAFPEALKPIAIEFMNADPENFLTIQGLDLWVKKQRTKEEQSLPEALFGKIQTGSFADTDTTIKEFSKKYGKLLGVPDGKDSLTGYREFRKFSHANGKWIQYTPHKGGLDDISAMMTYVFRDNGTLCAVMGRYRPVTGNVGGGLSRKAAIKKAQAQIKLDIPFAEPNISGPVKITECLVDDPGDERKSVRLIGVTLDVGDPPKPKRVLMLGSGEVLYTEDGAYQVSGQVFANDPESDSESTVSKDLPDIIHPGAFWRSYVIDGKNVKPDPGVASHRASSFLGFFNEKPFEPDPSEPFAEVNTYHYITKALAKAREGGLTEDETKPFLPLYYDHWVYPDCAHLDPDEKDKGKVKKQKEEAAEACFEQQSNNAWFNPTSTRLYFAMRNFNKPRKKVGDKETYKHPAYEGTVIVHEFGHWMHYVMNPHHDLTGTNNANLEARSCAEGVADIFAALTQGDHVIANYYLEDQKRDLSKDTKYIDVIPIMNRRPKDGEKGASMHNASLAFSSCFWKLKSDLGEGLALKVLIGAMRVCHLPGRFQNMAQATLAMDQLLNPSPMGKRMAYKMRDNQIIQGVVPAQ